MDNDIVSILNQYSFKNMHEFIHIDKRKEFYFQWIFSNFTNNNCIAISEVNNIDILLINESICNLRKNKTVNKGALIEIKYVHENKLQRYIDKDKQQNTTNEKYHPNQGMKNAITRDLDKLNKCKKGGHVNIKIDKYNKNDKLQIKQLDTYFLFVLDVRLNMKNLRKNGEYPVGIKEAIFKDFCDNDISKMPDDAFFNTSGYERVTSMRSTIYTNPFNGLKTACKWVLYKNNQ